MPSYTVSNGLRRVTPYYHDHRTPFKQRWAGRTVGEVLTSELGQNHDVVSQGIALHDIYVTKNNGKAGGPIPIKGTELLTRQLMAHDIIHNLQHVHEPSVIWTPNRTMIPTVNYFDGRSQSLYMMKCGVLILFDNKDIIVACKPSGVPTHPGGIYRYNTLLEIVANELGYPVWPCHRLDKSTLGIIVLAKTKLFCKAMMAVFRVHTQLEKQYLARVKGSFVHDKCSYRCPLISVNSSGGYLNVPKEVPTNSTTKFQRLAYLPESDESIVLCKPVTGRMHQIRIHLALLGHPISNDEYYNGRDGINSAKNQIEKMIYKNIFEKYPQFAVTGLDAPIPELITVSEFVTPEINTLLENLAKRRTDRDQRLITGKCVECMLPLYTENAHPGIYLHAFRLVHNWLQIDSEGLQTVPHFSFSTDFPSWCPAEKLSYSISHQSV